MPELVIAARSSPLSTWQAESTAVALRAAHPGLSVRIHFVTTTGDRILDSPLSKIGDKGLFTKELELALLAGEADVAVHSLKDVQTTLPDGLTLGAVTGREHVEDVLVAGHGMTIDRLPVGATVGTGSLRRRAQLLALRPDLIIADVRGNVGTRLAKYRSEGWAGMILARAGLVRLGWSDEIAEIIPPDRMIPAVGQGALGLEVRADDVRTQRLVGVLDHAMTRRATDAERSFLRHLEGGCQIPIGAWGRVESDIVVLDGIIASLDGRRVVRGHAAGDNPIELGRSLAESLLGQGGDTILAEVRQGEEG